MPTSTATQAPTAAGRYTYTCLDCPYNAAPDRWDTLDEAALAATLAGPGHQAGCPGQARLLAISLNPKPHTGHPANAITPYDPDELIAVPAWTLLIARGLAATVAHRAKQHRTIDFGQHAHTTLLAEAALAFDPLPGRPAPETADELAELLRLTADVLTSSLQTP
ncbi:hypothetical protein ABZ671_16795 [Micromonospora sp. NPDC006766]|uniref:hypothetical protein n=1 Tax=Micromonospora sp. NPDC006766 TaxID=3154778 RepID=UPI0033CD4667